MKTTIAGILTRNAIEYVQKARIAKTNKQPDDEVRYSIGAHLMIALALEGIGNEIGEIAFGKKEWKRKDKIGTFLKWRIISEITGKEPFKDNEEPLKTIEHINTIRNHIVHPKIKDLGVELIIRSKNGKLTRNTSPEYVLQAGDHIWAGVGKLLDEFNCRTSFENVKKSVLAIKKLRNHLSITGLEWIDDMYKILNKNK